MNDDYISKATRTESVPYLQLTIEQTRLLHAAMGLATEAGEFLDAIKKHLFYKKPLDLANLKEELGDSFWYAAIAADSLGTTFEEIQRVNIEKLKARYPDKFTTEKAINRDLTAERVILECRP